MRLPGRPKWLDVNNVFDPVTRDWKVYAHYRDRSVPIPERKGYGVAYIVPRETLDDMSSADERRFAEAVMGRAADVVTEAALAGDRAYLRYPLGVIAYRPIPDDIRRAFGIG